MQESGEQKGNYFFIFISFLALFAFSFMKYMDPFLLHPMENKISRLKLHILLADLSYNTYIIMNNPLFS